jgi:LEA14-like dessication related protein
MAAGMTNSSPAGVRVSVGTTGMSAVLDPSGRFTFIDVPENAELHFTRGEDNIDARIAAGTGPMQIVLAASGASNGKAKHSPVAGLLQYEGLVQEISATSIKVNGVTFTIDGETIIRKGKTTLTPEDIKVDDRVHVKATAEKLAYEIKLQNPDAYPTETGTGSQTMTANGLVTAAGATELKVQTQPHGEVTVQVNADTIIKKQGVRISVTDIKAGDEINSMGTRVDDHTLLARQIEVRGKSK